MPAPVESLTQSQSQSHPASSSGKTYPLVRGYEIVQLVGGGGFSKVFRAIQTDATHPVVAIKVVSYAPTQSRHAADFRALQKEVQIHSLLKHINVLEFLFAEEIKEKDEAAKVHVAGLYMVLEFGAGGDLFDHISPDIGVEEELAHFYFTQLISGLEYVHEFGVAHRDIKPENLLLDKHGNLKIADFGLCSVYKHKGSERTLKGACGSLPYIAPEMNGRPYAGEPVDVWSSGIVLFALLVGNSAWDEPTDRSPEYEAYKSGDLFRHDPWTRLTPDMLSILRHILCIDVTRRYSLKQIKQHRWFRRPNRFLKSGDTKCADPTSLAERLLQGLIVSGDLELDLHSDGKRASVPKTVSLTQPEAMQRETMGLGAGMGVPTSSAINERVRYAISQHMEPGHSQLTQAFNNLTQFGHLTVNATHLRFVAQHTRFFSAHSAHEIAKRLIEALDDRAVQNAIQPLGRGGVLSELAATMRLNDEDEEMEDPEEVRTPIAGTPPAATTASSSAASASAPTPKEGTAESELVGSQGARIRVWTMDRRKCILRGEIRIEVLPHDSKKARAVGLAADGIVGREGQHPECLVMMRRSKGNPLEWKRLYKEITRDMGVRNVMLPL